MNAGQALAAGIDEVAASSALQQAWLREMHWVGLPRSVSDIAMAGPVKDLLCASVITWRWRGGQSTKLSVQLAGAGAGAVGGALLGRAASNEAGGRPGAAGGQDAGGFQNLGGPRGGDQPGGSANQISNVLNGGNRGPGGNDGNGNGNGNGGFGGSRGGQGGNGGDQAGNRGDRGGRSAADIAASSPQGNVFRSDARTAASYPRATPSLMHAHSADTLSARSTLKDF